MERLTNSDKEIPTLSNNAEYWLQAYFKLKDYEDLEEQGLLLKLPCKVGTKVYAFLPSDNHFTECQINKIEIKPTIYGNMCYFIEPTAHRGCLYRYFENDYGKTVFLTQEEAEAKLKESRQTRNVVDVRSEFYPQN